MHDVRSGDAEEPTVVIDTPNQIRRAEDAPLAVELDSIVAPRRLEQFVHDFDVLFGLGVSIIVLNVAR